MSSQTREGQFRLTMHTSMLSVYSDGKGAVGLFELSSQFTSKASLCSVLAKVAAVRFADKQQTLWSQAPNRFTFKDREFIISMPHGDLRIAPAEAGAVYAETAQLLRSLTDHLLPRWQLRRSKLYRS